MAFQNREDAARQLAERLTRYRGLNPVVLGVPRGGVPLARIIADALGGDLDVILVRKIGDPENPGCAVAALDESGTITLMEDGRHCVPDEHIECEARRQLDVIRRLRQLYTPALALDLGGRTVIVDDDGIATGNSMLAAVRAVRRQHPRRLVVAIPVAAPGCSSRFGVRRTKSSACCSGAACGDLWLLPGLPAGFRRPSRHVIDGIEGTEFGLTAVIGLSAGSVGVSRNWFA